jgi:hypothetical protein
MGPRQAPKMTKNGLREALPYRMGKKLKLTLMVVQKVLSKDQKRIIIPYKVCYY